MNKEEGENIFWPSLADMAVATCIILAIFWISQVFLLQKEKEMVLASEETIKELKEEISRLENLVGRESELADRIQRLENDLAQQKDANQRLEIDLEKSERERLSAEGALAELRSKVPHDEPPNIVLTQDESFVFPSLQATVPADFERRFKSEKRQAVIDALNSPSNVEVIEIIGHTDNVQVGGSSNVDINLEDVFAGNKPINSLEFGSNCELGLARAIAVKAMLNEILQSLDIKDGLTVDGMNRVRQMTYRTYSAAQLFPVDSSKAGREADRRIEIRFTRLRSD
ncbi:MAG: hypothetical protein O3A87_01465 [Verrucomicrobia bacterium]|nr:hypothetical protein [Verrucomicrobiota bacterium]